MNDPYINDEAGEVAGALGQRMDAVRELISQLIISPAASVKLMLFSTVRSSKLK